MFCNLIRLRNVRPEAISSMNEAATCATIRALRSPWPLCVVRLPSRRGGATSIRPEKAGIEPKTRPVTTDVISVNSRTFLSRLISAPRLVSPSAKGDDQLQRRRREHQAEQSARDREQQALGQHLAEKSAAAGAERCAHRQLALALDHPGEQEIGDRGADDEQDETGGAEQDQQRQAEVPSRSSFSGVAVT